MEYLLCGFTHIYNRSTRNVCICTLCSIAKCPSHRSTPPPKKNKTKELDGNKVKWHWVMSSAGH